MPPSKRPSRKATAAQSTSDGDAESGTESANDLRDLEESLKISMVVDVSCRAAFVCSVRGED